MATQLAAMDTRYGFTQEQIEVVKATIAQGASNDELALFLMVCQKTGLDPFSRQIYLSERRSKDPRTDQWVSKKTPETTIDGFRVIAERSGQYAGQLGPYWCGPDGEWKDVWLSDNLPAAAKVGIVRHDFKEPVWGVALFCEYVQTLKDGTPNSMWKKMGANQLAKCAESLGLRKAFPRDLSGMYSKEEMAQAEERGSKEAQQEVKDRRITELKAQAQLPPATPAATIIELADSLDAPPPSDLSYEERQTRIRAEADKARSGIDKALSVERPQSGTPAETRHRGTIPFKELPRFRTMKEEMRKVVGDDHVYYDILKLALINHADELNEDNYKKVYKLMAETYTKLKGDGNLKADLAKHRERIGGTKFLEVLGANGFESLEHVISEANGQQVQAVLDELKGTA